MNVRKVSVICPVFNEEKFIEECIMSIIEQDYPQDMMEVLFVDGRSTDKTREIIERYMRQYPFIKLLDNPERIVPYALNRGLEAAKGEVIMRLDGHCTYPTNYISELVRYLYQLNADNVGGVWNTQPAKDTPICQAIAQASSHPFGVGGSMHKIGASKIIETDTVPFGCYKREIFEKLSTGIPFVTNHWRNCQHILAIYPTCLHDVPGALSFYRHRGGQHECYPHASAPTGIADALRILQYSHELRHWLSRWYLQRAMQQFE